MLLLQRSSGYRCAEDDATSTYSRHITLGVKQHGAWSKSVAYGVYRFHYGVQHQVLESVKYSDFYKISQMFIIKVILIKTGEFRRFVGIV